LSAAAADPARQADGDGLRDRLRAELARLHAQATDPAARANFEHMQRRLDEGAPIFLAGDPPWAAASTEERIRREAARQAALEAAGRGELATLGWRPGGDAVDAELRRRGRR
jgi:hypothetical protein